MEKLRKALEARHTRNKGNPLRLRLRRVSSYPRQDRAGHRQTKTDRQPRGHGLPPLPRLTDTASKTTRRKKRKENTKAKGDRVGHPLATSHAPRPATPNTL